MILEASPHRHNKLPVSIVPDIGIHWHQPEMTVRSQGGQKNDCPKAEAGPKMNGCLLRRILSLLCTYPNTYGTSLCATTRPLPIEYSTPCTTGNKNETCLFVFLFCFILSPPSPTESNKKAWEDVRAFGNFNFLWRFVHGRRRRHGCRRRVMQAALQLSFPNLGTGHASAKARELCSVR